jgi:heme exporter protein C
VDGHVHGFYRISFYSIKYLNTGKEKYDLIAVECVNTGLFFFVLGLVTGMLWAKYTWGEFWSNDPKQNSAAIAFLLYCAYSVLRNSIDEEQNAPKYQPSITFLHSRS